MLASSPQRLSETPSVDDGACRPTETIGRASPKRANLARGQYGISLIDSIYVLLRRLDIASPAAECLDEYMPARRTRFCARSVSRPSPFSFTGFAWPASIGTGSIADGCAGASLKSLEDEPSTPGKACSEQAKGRTISKTAAIASPGRCDGHREKDRPDVIVKG